MVTVLQALLVVLSIWLNGGLAPLAENPMIGPKNSVLVAMGGMLYVRVCCMCIACACVFACARLLLMIGPKISVLTYVRTLCAYNVCTVCVCVCA